MKGRYKLRARRVYDLPVDCKLVSMWYSLESDFKPSSRRYQKHELSGVGKTQVELGQLVQCYIRPPEGRNGFTSHRVKMS